MKIKDVVSLSNSTAVVTWDPPIQPNGIITAYEVIHSIYDDVSSRITVPVTNSTNSLNITDLCKLQIHAVTTCLAALVSNILSQIMASLV